MSFLSPSLLLAALPLASSGWSSVVQSSNSTHEGGQLAEEGPIPWGAAALGPEGGDDDVVTVELDATTRRQRIFGFGGAFTEAAGVAFSRLSAQGQARVLSRYWGAEGLGYSTGRVAMNSPDFALGHYSYANTSGDTALASFQHGLPRDNEYVLPLLRAALRRSAVPLRLFSAPWSPPAWMKVPFNPGGQGAMDVCRPDSLRPELRDTWAKYFSLWHTAMAKQIGQPFWAFSAQNEPLAHGHMWDCCGYTLQNYTDFVSNHLRPVMQADHPELRFLAFDHNPDAIEAWVSAVFADAATKEWAFGSAVHWYSAPAQRGAALNRTHASHPDKPILHTEGCVCRNLFYKNQSAWWSVGEVYVRITEPFPLDLPNLHALLFLRRRHRWPQGVGLFQYLQNWAVGFTDWNLLLDSDGGPSHDRRFGCNAPMMLDAAAPGGVAIQAPYYFLAHFSKFLPENSTVLGAMAYEGARPAPLGSFYYDVGAEGADGKRLAVLGAEQPNGTSVLIVMNTASTAVRYRLVDPRMTGTAALSIPPHAIQTLRWNAPS